MPLRRRTLIVAFGRMIGPNDRGDSKKSMLLRRPKRDGDCATLSLYCGDGSPAEPSSFRALE